MTAAVIICLAACLIFAATAPAAGRRLPPATATRLLTAGAVLAAGSVGFVLAVLAFVWIGQLHQVATLGNWSAATLRQRAPLPAITGVLAGALLAPLALLGTRTAVRRGRALVTVHRACHRLARPGQVAVIDSPVPQAFTTPEARGRIVITTGLLAALTAGQRRALVAHERSHLTHRHAWWRLVADLSAAVNPLLRPAAATVTRATERWADEDAARTVGDRRLVATAIAAAAIARRHERATLVPAADGGQVPQRVRALLAPPPRARPMLLAALILMLATGVGAATAVERSGEHLFEHALRADQHTPTRTLTAGNLPTDALPSRASRTPGNR